MKKFLFVISFILFAVISFAQYIPQPQQSLGSPTGEVYAKGVLGLDSSFHFRVSYADTAAASRGFLENMAGNIVLVGDTLWMRNQARNAWIKLGAGSASSINIYNTSSSLTGNRTLSGTGIYSLLFNNLSDFQVGDNVGTNRLQVSNVRTKLFSPLQTITFEVGDSSRWTGIGTSASTTGLFFPLVNQFSGAITKTSAASIGLNQIDVFIIAGQSNAVGNSTTPSAAPTPLAGTAFQFYSGSISAAVEPIGNSNGSAWPAFAISYYKQTGRKICFVPAGVNGSSMAAAAAVGFGTWDTTGTLYSTSVTLANNALVVLAAQGYAPVFKGILWSQGETDADGINRGTITQNVYSAAFAKLIKNYRLQFGKTISFNISRTGFRTDTIQTGYLAVQSTQASLANPDSLINMTYWNPPFFIQRSLMQDVYHYTQPGYNEMGRIMAEEYVNATSNNWQTQAGTIFFKKGNVGIGDVIPQYPLHLYNTGTAAGIRIEDSLNDAVRLDIVNKRNAGFSGAGLRLYNSTGLGAQMVYLSGASSLEANGLWIFNSVGNTLLGSDNGILNLYTGGTATPLNAKLRITASGLTGIGANVTPDNSAQLDVQSTTRGLRVPTMTGAQMTAISSPATGLMVYNTDSLNFCQYNGTAWRLIGGSSSTASVFSQYLMPNYNQIPETGIVPIATDSICFVGDSYGNATSATNIAYGCAQQLARQYGCILSNYSVSGSTVEKRVPIDYNGTANLIDRLPGLPAAASNKKLLIIAMGLNDVGQTAAAYNPVNFKTDYDSCMNYLINTKGWNPRNILIIPPYYLGQAGYNAYSVITSNARQTPAGHMVFVDTTRGVAKKWNAMFFNLYDDQFRNDTTLFAVDAIHANDAGYTYIFKAMWAYLGTGATGNLWFATGINSAVTFTPRGVNTTSASTSPPFNIDLGGTFSSAAATPGNSKLKLFNNGTANSTAGFGVTSSGVDYHSFDSHLFYELGVRVATIDPTLSEFVSQMQITKAGNTTLDMLRISHTGTFPSLAESQLTFSSGATNLSRISLFYGGGTNDFGLKLYSYGGAALNTTPFLTGTNLNNVGLNTAAPISKLHVVGTVRGTDSLIIAGTSHLTGGVGIATSGSASFGLSLAGSWTSGVVGVGGGITPSAGVSGSVFSVSASITESSSGVHALLAGANFSAPTISGAAATVTNTATVTIGGAPSATVTGANYAFWVNAGRTKLGGSEVHAYRTVSANTSFDSEADYFIEVTANSPTVTLPDATGLTGMVFTVINSGAGTVSLATTGGQVIGNTGAATSMNVVAAAATSVVSTGAAWRIY